jgi:multiple sugar transport system ATP-binding protein
MRAEIIKLRQRINTTFVYVTHDQTEAMTLGDRIVVMKDGFIQQIGAPKEVFQNPANVFVAGFIGSPQMNLFHAALEKRDGRYAVKLDKAVIFLSDDRQRLLEKKASVPEKIILGIRPEHMVLTHRENPASVKARVDVSEMMGSEIYLHTNLGDADVVIRIALVDLPADKKDGFSHQDEINFTFSGDLCHVFDADTEKNLLRE